MEQQAQATKKQRRLLIKLTNNRQYAWKDITVAQARREIGSNLIAIKFLEQKGGI